MTTKMKRRPLKNVTALDVSVAFDRNTQPATLIRVMQTRSLLITDNKIALPTCDTAHRVPQTSSWRASEILIMFWTSRKPPIPGTVSIFRMSERRGTSVVIRELRSTISTMISFLHLPLLARATFWQQPDVLLFSFVLRYKRVPFACYTDAFACARQRGQEK